MSTIPERIGTIADNIQTTFEELIKLLLRKTLRPALNPLGNNTRIIYNPVTGRNERGYLGRTVDDNINKYSYEMTRDSLGWTTEFLTNFRAVAKFTKHSFPDRHPAGNTLTRNSKLLRRRVAYSEQQKKNAMITGRIPPKTSYKNFVEYVTSRNIQNVISNRNASFAYTCDIPYSDSHKNLTSIGRDIISQTDPMISPVVSSQMSTSQLRICLFNLELSLFELADNNPELYSSYIDMVRIVNSVDRCNIPWVINLISVMCYSSWDDLCCDQQGSYIEALGHQFICDFTANQIICILMQGGAAEIIIVASYLFPLLKMLFSVFGFSLLIPNIVDCCTTNDVEKRDKLDKYFNDRKGAYMRRGECPIQNLCCQPDNCCSCSSDNKACCEPVDPCTYEFIKSFCDLYPTIISIMGGSETFPQECLEVCCDDIPPNYFCLNTIPDFLWRFNDFSYCNYITVLRARQDCYDNNPGTKINAKNRSLLAL
jgi:hypothetical protein